MLKQLHLKNWRSLRDVTIDFTPITVFIGANSSGKTNIIDALKFRRYAARNGIRQAITRWNVNSEVLTQGIDAISAEVGIEYLTMDQKTHSNNLKVGKKDGFIASFYNTPRTDYRENYILESFENFIANRVQILEEGFNPEIYQTRNLDQPLDLIDGKAGNILAVFDYIKQVSPEIYEKFSEELHYILAHVDGVDILSENKEFQLVVQEKRHIAQTISAGTLRVAAMLLTFYVLEIFPEEKPVLANGEGILLDPGLVIIEEPDAALNPGVLERLVNVMRRFTEGDNPRQIILTTHNPTFLNYFKPEEVRVVERDEEGISQVYPVPHDILDGLETIDTLGEVWLTRSLGGIGG